MQNSDLMCELKALYSPPKGDPVLVEVPPMDFLMVDGQGDPNTSVEFQQAMEALFGVSYTLKFAVKKGPLGVDYRVMPPEALWWMRDMRAFDPERRGEWKWTMMIAQPEFITPEMVAEAVEAVRRKKGAPALAKLRFERFEEGRCAQIMHIGPYAEEGPTIVKLHSFIREHGYELRGKHHEIYLSDPRRAQPEKLKTVVRQPVG